MTIPRRVVLSVGCLVIPSMTVAQTHLDLSAATHVAGPALWFGGDVAVEHKGVAFHLVGAWSSPFKRFAGEGRAEVGYHARIGPAAIGLGIAGIRRTGPGLLTGVGPTVSTSVAIGEFSLSGNFSRFATVTQSLSAVTTALNDSVGGPGASARVLSHFGLGAQWHRGRYSLDGRIMRRTGIGLPGQLGWLAGVGLQVGPWSRVSASVGRMPAQEAIYLPLRNQVTMGLAFTRRRHRSEPPSVTAAGGFGLEVVPVTRGHTLRIRVPAAGRVELNGDFTNWQPVDLERTESDLWETTLPLASGVYHLNMRIDGGPWTVPAGLASEDDGFGSRTGVLRIP